MPVWPCEYIRMANEPAEALAFVRATTFGAPLVSSSQLSASAAPPPPAVSKLPLTWYAADAGRATLKTANEADARIVLSFMIVLLQEICKVFVLDAITHPGDLQFPFYFVSRNV